MFQFVNAHAFLALCTLAAVGGMTTVSVNVHRIERASRNTWAVLLFLFCFALTVIGISGLMTCLATFQNNCVC